MLNFYPGPSKLDARISQYYQEAVASGILEKNHRSSDFELLYKHVKKLFHTKLSMPQDYSMLFVSSATECWEIISQSLSSSGTTHFYNGAFGEKWFKYAAKINPKSNAFEFGLEGSPELLSGRFGSQILAFTQNETSNGTQLSNEIQQKIRKHYPNHLIAYDATSSLGGIYMDWTRADIWFASVQKCFGLPAGLGVLIVNKRAIDCAKVFGDRKYYNSLLFMLENASKNQTHYTPNISNIYLLSRLLEERDAIDEIGRNLKERALRLYFEFDKLKSVKPLITNTDFRSSTVLTLEGGSEKISSLKIEAAKEGFILGNGYGKLQDSTVRIANFPAITNDEFDHLLLFLSDFDKMY
jgi:phosphoserine aminotransferase